MDRFEGRVAVVTGAASGIGRATAERLAREGCALALVDLDEARLEETRAAVRALGARVSLHAVDVADPERMAALPGEVVAEHGAVHILVNNAGVALMDDFEDNSLEDLRWIVGINFWGVVHGCKFFLPELRKVDQAHIVNISSMFGFVGLPTQSAYCATKFAVRGLSEALFAELRETPIGVTSVHPGGIKTNIVQAGRTTDEVARGETQGFFDRHAHPPEQVADAIVAAIRKRKLRAIVGWEAHLVEWLKRAFPVSLHRVVAWRRARS